MADHSRDKKGEAVEGYKTVDIRLVDRPDLPVRQTFNEQELDGLTKSICDKGVLVPLLVRPKGARFEIIDGDRRLEACWRNKFNEIPVVVRVTSDSETLIQRMLANLDRENPDPVEEAIYIARAIKETNSDVAEFSKLLGRSVRWLSDRLVIAEMPEYIQSALRNKEVPLGVAVKLFEIDDEIVLRRYFGAALRDGMTIKAAQQCVHQYEMLKESFEQVGETMLPEQAPEPVIVPQARCERCGQIDYVDRMRIVRIHRDQCQTE